MDTALVWLLVIVVSQALSGLAYHGVEHPLERLLRGAARRSPGPHSAPAPQSPGEPARTG